MFNNKNQLKLKKEEPEIKIRKANSEQGLEVNIKANNS